MRVAVIDVGSNTARLLVADVGGSDGSVVSVAEERTFLRLGAEIERTGMLGKKKIAAAADVCGAYARRASELGAERSTVIVTAPGRATSLPVRLLSAEDEGRLAYDGAIAVAKSELRGVVAVVDVGGGSTEIAVGAPPLGATWIRSADLGSLRLTRAHLHHDPASKRELAAATDAVRRSFERMQPPASDIALAVGGSARAIAKILGPRFAADDLDEAVAMLSRRPPGKVARAFGIGAERAATVLAGALLLTGASQVLGRSLELGRGGLREGAALELAAREAARAA